jgi:hypothetical protein
MDWRCGHTKNGGEGVPPGTRGEIQLFSYALRGAAQHHWKWWEGCKKITRRVICFALRRLGNRRKMREPRDPLTRKEGATAFGRGKGVLRFVMGNQECLRLLCKTFSPAGRILAGYKPPSGGRGHLGGMPNAFAFLRFPRRDQAPPEGVTGCKNSLGKRECFALRRFINTKKMRQKKAPFGYFVCGLQPPSGGRGCLGGMPNAGEMRMRQDISACGKNSCGSSAPLRGAGVAPSRAKMQRK